MEGRIGTGSLSYRFANVLQMIRDLACLMKISRLAERQIAPIIGQHLLYMEKGWMCGRPMSALERQYKTTVTDKEDIKGITDKAKTNASTLCDN